MGGPGFKGGWGGKGWNSGASSGGWSAGGGGGAGWSGGDGFKGGKKGGGWASGGGGYGKAKGGKWGGLGGAGGAEGGWGEGGAWQEEWGAAVEGGGDAPPERTLRIWPRYQLPKAILRPSADRDGSAFSKEVGRRISDQKYLSEENLRQITTSDSSHLLRRPGVGLSECVASWSAGLDVLRQMCSDSDSVGMAELLALFDRGGEDLAQAMIYIYIYIYTYIHIYIYIHIL